MCRRKGVAVLLGQRADPDGVVMLLGQRAEPEVARAPGVVVLLGQRAEPLLEEARSNAVMRDRTEIEGETSSLGVA